MLPKLEPITVTVPYHSNAGGLVATLMNLQAQLVPPRAIVVVDTSPDKSGFKLAQRYTTNNVPIIVEVAPVGIYEAWNKGLELAGDSDVLIINDDLLMPMNMIDVLMISRAAVPGLAYVPITPTRDHARPNVHVEFPWYAKVPEVLEEFAQADWLPGFCFMLTKEAVKLVGRFDTHFKIWFGDDDYQRRLVAKGRELNVNPIVLVKTLYAYHYGGSSYKYLDKRVQAKIVKDRRTFKKKYAHG